MIQIKRGTAPSKLSSNQKKWTNEFLNARTKKEQDHALVHYRDPTIKKALIKTFQGKCAYCESKVLHIDYGNIEHFRPKSWASFKHLAFDWDNLLLSCSVCNGSAYKGTKFPDQSHNGPLLNPCTDNPASHLRFLYDAASGVASVLHKTSRGETSIKCYGLNRPDLRT